MSTETNGAGFLISRIFEASRVRLWQALTEAAHMKQWWSPVGFTMIEANMDFRLGGAFHCCMRSVDGYKMWCKFVYREIAAPERLVFVNVFSNEAGDITRHPLLQAWPLETLTTVTLEDEPGAKAKLTVQSSAYNATDEERKTFDSWHGIMHQTWSGTLDQLAAHLAKA